MAIYTHTPTHKSWCTLASVGSTAGPADGPPVYILSCLFCVWDAAAATTTNYHHYY